MKPVTLLETPITDSLNTRRTMAVPTTVSIESHNIGPEEGSSGLPNHVRYARSRCYEHSPPPLHNLPPFALTAHTTPRLSFGHVCKICSLNNISTGVNIMTSTSFHVP